MELPPFELHRPATVEEAVALAARLVPAVDFVAGGTDLWPNYKNRLNPRPHVIALSGIAALRARAAGRLGALVRLREIEEDEALRRTLPGLWEAALAVASPLVRATATVGGNLCVEPRCYYFNQSDWWRAAKGGCLKDLTGDRCLVTGQAEGCVATYSGDLAPMLLCYDAAVELIGPLGIRRLPLADFFRDDGIDRDARAPGELITAVLIAPDERTLTTGYRKLRVRDSVDFPLLGVAAGLALCAGRVSQLRVALTAVRARPYRLDALTAPLVGGPWGAAQIEELAEQAMDDAQPVKNLFSSTVYRKKMVRVFLRRLLVDLTARAERPLAATR